MTTFDIFLLFIFLAFFLIGFVSGYIIHKEFGDGQDTDQSL